MPTRLAIIGDHSSAVLAHQAIPRALELAARAESQSIEPTWVPTPAIGDPRQTLARYSGVWVVPGSPYADMDGALRAIAWARENRRPILGSCGGFQHMLIELARDCAGLSAADHAETNPGGAELVVTALACSLVDQTGPLHFAAGSRIREFYGQDTAIEGYRCSYGMNPAYRARLEATGLRFTAFDDNGEIRAAELPVTLHPFFLGTLFQSERAALRGETPPLARALVRAAAAFSP